MQTIQRNLSAYRNEIKGIAILWVIFFHAQLGLTGAVNIVQQIGYGGVDIFFFLSGYGLYHSLEKDADPGRYLARRGLRILPAYLPFCLVWLAVMIPLYGGGIATSVRIAAGNLTMLGYFAHVPLMINWYVSALAVSLIAAPLLHGCLRAGKHYWLRAAVLMGVLFLFGLSFIGHEFYMAASRLPVFALGMVFARPCERKTGGRGIAALLAAGCALGLAALLICMDRYHELLLDYAMCWHPFVLITPALCAGLGWLFAHLPRKLLAPLRVMGAASFEIFLFNAWLEVWGNTTLRFPMAWVDLWGPVHRDLQRSIGWVILSLVSILCGILYHYAVNGAVKLIRRKA